MGRKEFFELAQKATVYTKQFRDLSKPLLTDCIVISGDIKYYPQYVKVGYDEQGKVENVAILHDLKANAIIECKLERVEKYEQSGSNSID